LIIVSSINNALNTKALVLLKGDKKKQMKSLNILLFIILGNILLLSSCKVEPKAIDYGKDQCSFCKMNIVDKSHSAQFVTKKRKQFKFDAIECLVRDIAKKNENEIAIFLVADYSNPGSMIDAKTANYIISPNIKSPMGANLSAVENMEIAEQLHEDNGGSLYNWMGLKQKLGEK